MGSKRLEGFAIRASGDSAGMLSIKYSAHIQGIGDTETFSDGDFCGTRGKNKRVEAIYVQILPTTVTVHLDNIGDKNFKLSEWAGTKGESRRLEGFEINRASLASLEYMAHIQDDGDTEWTTGFVGTRGQSKRLEGFAIRASGDSVGMLSVKYSAHVQGIGDTETFSDGDFCGT